MNPSRVRRFLSALARNPFTVPVLVALLGLPAAIWLAIRTEQNYQAEQTRQAAEAREAEELRAEQAKALQFIRETDALRAKDRERGRKHREQLEALARMRKLEHRWCYTELSDKERAKLEREWMAQKLIAEGRER
jgi:hypothetical protein